VNVSFYEDSFVKPSLVTVDRWTSRAPYEGRHGAWSTRRRAACSICRAGSKVGAWGAFEPALGRTSIRAGPVGSAPDAQCAQGAWTNPSYRRAPSLRTATRWWPS